MSITLQIFLVILLIIQTVIMIETLKKKNMSMKYATMWLGIIFVLFIFSFFPNILISISKLFGFKATSNMVFLGGYFILFYLIFIQSIELSKQKKEIVKLIQELSILKKDKKDGKKD